ncbi:MAG: DUF1648 domain-containing protein [Salinibacter sp.]|uniref:DUF1648 domain-containing protein n=1 Tax=Salinibacter sp. TaxID=2065818 RepID=UPI002FC2EE28
MRRLVHGLNAGLALLLIGGSLWAFPRLPARIPRHFGLGGTADAYWDATLLHWMLVPAIALVVVGIVYGAAWWTGHAPGSVNVPNQQKYDALAPAEKRVILRDVQVFLYGAATAMLVLFSVIQASTYHVATTGANALPTAGWGVSIAMPVGLLVAALGLAWWLPRRVRGLADDP